MATYIRYALASVCFAASVACLALWGWSITTRAIVNDFDHPKSETRYAISNDRADLIITAVRPGVGTVSSDWYSIIPQSKGTKPGWAVGDRFQGLPHYIDYYGVRLILFPYWFLITIASMIGFLIWPKFRFQVSIRAALLFITTIVVMIAMDTVARR